MVTLHTKVAEQVASLQALVGFDSGDTLNRNAKAAALSIFEGTKQRFFAQLLLSMKLPSLIPAMEEAGHLEEPDDFRVMALWSACRRGGAHFTGANRLISWP